MRFEREGHTTVFDMMGRFEASRAVNPPGSDGPTMAELGVLPRVIAEAPSEVIAPPPSFPAREAVAAPEQPRVVEHIPNAVNLDKGIAHLNGRFLTLSSEAITAITALVIEAYAAQVQDELLSLRMEFLPHGSAQSPTNSVSGQAPAPASEQGSSVRPLPAPVRRRRKVWPVQSVQEGEVPAPPPNA